MSVKQAVGEGTARGITEAITAGKIPNLTLLINSLMGEGGGDTVLTKSGVTDDALSARARARYRVRGAEKGRALDQLIKVLPAPHRSQFTTICNAIVVLPFLDVLGTEGKPASTKTLDLGPESTDFDELFSIWDQMVSEFVGAQDAELAVALTKKYGLFGDATIPKGLALLKRRVNSRGQAVLDGLGSIWADLGNDAEGKPGSLARRAKKWRKKLTAKRPDSWGAKVDRSFSLKPPQRPPKEKK